MWPTVNHMYTNIDTSSWRGGVGGIVLPLYDLGGITKISSRIKSNLGAYGILPWLIDISWGGMGEVSLDYQGSFKKNKKKKLKIILPSCR